jgi:monoamine oxidase
VYLKRCFIFLITMLPMCADTDVKKQKIVVIGGGVAGLTTAYRLYKKGFDVHLYEARNRLGGRVFSANIDGKSAELGAQNLADGGEAKHVKALVKELGLELIEKQRKFNHVFFDGERVSSAHELFENQTFTPENVQARLDDAAKLSKNMRDVLNQLLKPQEKIYKYLSSRLAGYEGFCADHLSCFYLKTLEALLLGGLSVAHQKNDDMFIFLMSIKGGLSKLPQALGDVLGERVHTNMPLVSVVKTNPGSYLLTFRDGQKVYADTVVFAMPCPVYQDIFFSDGVIPQDRLNAIKNVRQGTNGRMLIPFEGDYSKVAPSFMTDNFVTFLNVDGSILNVHTFQSSDHRVSRVSEEMYHDVRKLLVKYQSEQVLSSRAPSRARDELFGVYQGPVIHNWVEDPFAKGSYSYIVPGQEQLLTALADVDGEVVRKCFAPVDQKIYFAGEHTTILFDVTGTVEAACESGERAARMIAKSYKSKKIV